MLGARGVGRDKGQVHLGLQGRGKLHLGFFRGLFEPLKGHLVVFQVDSPLFFEAVGNVVHEPVVKIIPAQVGVSVGGLNLEHPVSDFQNGNVKGAAAQVKHGDLALFAAVHAIGQGRGRGLVDDAQHVEPGDLARVLGGLALAVIKIGRHGDHRVGHFLAQIFLGRFFQGAQNKGGNFRGAVGPIPQLHGGVVVGAFFNAIRQHGLVFLHLGRIVFPAHEPLDAEHGVFRIGHGLALGHLAHQPLVVLGEGHNRWGGAPALGIGNDFPLFSI